MAFTTALVGGVCPPNGAMFGVSLGGTFLPGGPAIRQRGPCTAAKRKDVDFERWGSREIRLPVVRMTGPLLMMSPVWNVSTPACVEGPRRVSQVSRKPAVGLAFNLR